MNTLRRALGTLKQLARHPRRISHSIRRAASVSFALDFARSWTVAEWRDNPSPGNTLLDYYDRNTDGPGIWKFRHYFDIYERHLRKFVGTDARLLEIGIYSGGSLDMWRDYLGVRSHIIGVDIQDACKAYEGPQKTIVIGDQADREFWRSFRASKPPVDVVIDDGGHYSWQQQISVEELLPYLRPGGVYICEDVHGPFNHFSAFAQGLADALMQVGAPLPPPAVGGLHFEATPFQRSIRSVTFYPFAVVIERNEADPGNLVAEKHGTQWQPFLDHVR